MRRIKTAFRFLLLIIALSLVIAQQRSSPAHAEDAADGKLVVTKAFYGDLPDGPKTDGRERILAGNALPKTVRQAFSSGNTPFRLVGHVQAANLSLVWLQGTFFAPGNIFVTESSLEHVRLWDIRTAAPISNSLQQPNLNGFSLSAQGNRLFMIGGGEVQLWDVTTLKVRAAAKVAKSQVDFFDISSDGTRFLTIPDDDAKSLTVWNASNEKMTEIYRRRYAHELRSAQFDPTATYLVAEELSGCFHLLSARTGREVCPPIAGNNDTLSSTPYHAKFSATGGLLAVPLTHGFKLVESRSGKVLSEGAWEGPLETRQLALSPDGALVAIATWDGERVESGPILLFDTATAKRLRELGSGVSTCQMDPKGRWILANHAKTPPELLDLRTGTLLETFSGQGEKVGDALASPDGQTILVGSGSQTISVWRAVAPNPAAQP